MAGIGPGKEPVIGRSHEPWPNFMDVSIQQADDPIGKREVELDAILDFGTSKEQANAVAGADQMAIEIDRGKIGNSNRCDYENGDSHGDLELDGLNLLQTGAAGVAATDRFRQVEQGSNPRRIPK